MPSGAASLSTAVRPFESAAAFLRRTAGLRGARLATRTSPASSADDSASARVLAAHHVAALDLAADQCAGAGADDGVGGLRSARRKDLAAHAVGDAAHDQARRAVVAPAVVAVVVAAIDTVVPEEP